eukprot:439791_1
MIDDHQQYYLFSMDKIPHYQVRRMPSSSWISIRLGIIQQVVFKVLRLVNLTLDDLQFQIGSNDFHDGTLGHTTPLHLFVDKSSNQSRLYGGIIAFRHGNTGRGQTHDIRHLHQSSDDHTDTIGILNIPMTSSKAK